MHAVGQVVHVDLTRDWEPYKLRNALNAHLAMAGEAVAVLDAASVTEDFDARFSALRRHYLYRIICRKARLALEHKRAWWVSKDMDHERMHEAAQMLVGRHDFTTFRSVHCQANSPVRTLDRLDVTRTGDLIEIRATAQSFLHNRDPFFRGHAETGGRRHDDARGCARAALEARDRKACGPVAPPDGLYFMQVDYPDVIPPRRRYPEADMAEDAD